MTQFDENKITRIEIINHAKNDFPVGRVFILKKIYKHFEKVEIQIQDDGQTLKIFIK